MDRENEFNVQSKDQEVEIEKGILIRQENSLVHDGGAEVIHVKLDECSDEQIRYVMHILRRMILRNAGVDSISQKNLAHMPTTLRERIAKFSKTNDYYFGQVESLVLSGSYLKQDIKEWESENYSCMPKDLLGSEDLEIYYPAVTVGMKPVKTMHDLSEDDIENQRYIATMLIRGTIPSSTRQALISQCNRLVCPLDPLNKTFFSDKLVDECLRHLGSDSKKAINKVLGRSASHQVTGKHRRQALCRLWEETRDELIAEYEFENGYWDEYESNACYGFTSLFLYHLNKAVPYGSFVRHLEMVLAGLYYVGDMNGISTSDHFLDPRFTETWDNIAKFVELSSEVDFEALHGHQAEDTCQAQQWMLSKGLHALFGCCEEWWDEIGLVDLERGHRQHKDTGYITYDYREGQERMFHRSEIWRHYTNDKISFRINQKYSDLLDDMFEPLRTAVNEWIEKSK